tara:strand:- start:30150 stop:30368 length:219 start_codon:yes stop_codon:yes gene_type:complete
MKDSELFGEAHEQEENGLFGRRHESENKGIADGKQLTIPVVIPCDHRYHSRNGRYMLYEDWCEKCGTYCHEV